MTTQEQFCTNCILPNGFLGIDLNEEGLCNFCHDPAYQNPNWSKIPISDKRRREAKKDWNQVLEEMKSTNREYDCLLGYSGGKDSTALLYYLTQKCGLKVFVITIDTGFMTTIAKQNINQTLSTLGIEKKDYLIEEQAIDTFLKLYRWHFFNHTSNSICLTVNICQVCSDLIHSIAIKEAIKRNIPYVLFAYSPDQIKRYFYEIPQEDSIQWKPQILEELPFEKQDRSWYVSRTINKNNIPRILLPYHVMDYNEREIINLVESKGLISKGKADPVLTNCHVVKAALMYDFYRYGGLPYALQYAELVRQETEEKNHRMTRKQWLRTYNTIAKGIIQGTFNKEGIDLFLDKIGASKEALLDSIEKYRKSDPYALRILTNLKQYGIE
jgi:hypothetical protein